MFDRSLSHTWTYSSRKNNLSKQYPLFEDRNDRLSLVKMFRVSCFRQVFVTPLSLCRADVRCNAPNEWTNDIPFRLANADHSGSLKLDLFYFSKRVPQSPAVVTSDYADSSVWTSSGLHTQGPTSRAAWHLVDAVGHCPLRPSEIPHSPPQSTWL